MNSNAAPPISLDDKYALNTTRAYMTGIEALARLPMLQHQRDQDRGLNTAGFISGYRGSPLGGVDQTLWQASAFLKKHNIHFQPGINEDLAATAVWGSQQVNLFEGAKYDGVFGMWYGKGPGVDRSMDVIKHANAFGTSQYGGVLAIAGDDHASKSSTLPHQSEHMFIGASIPVLSPANVQEVLDLGVLGWEMSRYTGTWVALKAITENMDSAISAEIDPQRVKVVIPEDFQLPDDGVHARWPDAPLAQEQRLNKFKIYAAREFARVNNINRVVLDSERARLGIITTGKAYLDVMQALEDLGIDERKANGLGLRVFKVGMPWPLEPVATHAFAEGLDDILVVEEKRSIIEDQLTGQLYNWPVGKRPGVVGEFDERGCELLTNLGELTPAMVARAIAKRLRHVHGDDCFDEQIETRLKFYDEKERSLSEHKRGLERTPHYCSGCPHSVSTRIPEGSRAMGGIGCHYMGTWQKGNRQAYTFTQMGGEGVTWVGQAPFTETNHVFQNLGDGTYFHSGLLAIRQAQSAGVNITYKILYNDAVAMTGGQPVDGSLSIAQLIEQLRGEGIQRIALVSDHPEKHTGQLPAANGLSIDHRDQLLGVEKQLRDISGTTVLIYEQTCAAEKRRRRKKGLLDDPDRRIFINSAVCEGCGDCSTASNCLSVIPKETELGRKRQIDQSACNKDYSCVNGFCPSFVSVVGGRLKKSRVADRALDFPELPQPELASIEQRPWNIVVAGIGGTGVLTITALISMAAHIEGKGCATLNQTGLAQKFGSVISHVRVGQSQNDINSVRIPAGDADLLLGCDLVVAASEEAMAKVNVERSHAIINNAQTATAEFLSSPDIEFPADSLRQIIEVEVGCEKVRFVDAKGVAEKLLGDTIATNLFLLGYAYQRGQIPVSSAALEQAIELNNVAIDFNKKAFLWGRRAAQNLAQVIKLVKPEAAFKPLTRLADIVEDRFKRLVQYQDVDYAKHYRQQIDQVRARERQVFGEGITDLSVAAAQSLYKLMSYKDEYEVARLFSSPEFTTQIQKHFEGDYALRFHLAPPLLSKTNPETGFPEKRTFRGWIMPVYKILAGFKFLRGTRLDIFSYSSERQKERDWVARYENLLAMIVRDLDASNYAAAVDVARVPQTIRGFGHVKLKNMAQAEIDIERKVHRMTAQFVPLDNIS